MEPTGEIMSKFFVLETEDSKGGLILRFFLWYKEDSSKGSLEGSRRGGNEDYF